jgi:metal-responsive CopG/Arc/MetJ family transcriptional regulator
MSKSKRRIHITLPNPLVEALEALAQLEGRTISELIDDVARQNLRARGYEPRVTAEAISQEVAKRARKK